MIQILVGCISSGKTTYCRKRAQEGWIIMTDDAIVDAVHGGDYTLYDKALKPLYKSIENHIVHMAVAMGKNVVIDRGLNISAISRQRWITMSRSLDMPISAVIFEKFDPGIHARRRFDADPRGLSFEYWCQVANKHEAVYERPDLSEGYESIEEIKWEKNRWNTN